METMKELGGNRDWEKLAELKLNLEQAYKEEEVFWSQKARVHWLQEGDKNTQIFHATTVQRIKCN